MAGTMHFLAELSSPRFAGLATQTRAENCKLVALLPVGSIEQHGPLMPLGTDSLLAEGFCRTIAQHWDDDTTYKWRGIILPTFYYTNTETALDFPGTISVTHQPLRDIFHSLVSSILKLDIAALIIVSGHAPNDPALLELAFSLNQRQIRDKNGGKPVIVASLAQAMGKAYTLLELPAGRHADWLELCLLYNFLGPELITRQAEAFEAQKRATGPATVPLLGIPLKERSSVGVLGLGWPAEYDITDLAPRATGVVFDLLIDKIDFELAGAIAFLWPDDWK